jgi:hypothetical protein
MIGMITAFVPSGYHRYHAGELSITFTVPGHFPPVPTRHLGPPSAMPAVVIEQTRTAGKSDYDRPASGDATVALRLVEAA